jgi:SAM-dependent methyltransferase
MDRISKDTKKYYENTLKLYGSNFKGMNWSSSRDQYLRFDQLCKIGTFKNRSLHDLGCGNAELLIYLKKNKIKFKSYLGTDISADMIEVCKKKISKKKKISFKTLDIKKQIKFQMTDYVLASGIFSVKNNVSSKAWKIHVFNTIIKMFKFSKKGIAFNLMTFDVTFKNKLFFYMSVDEILRFLRKKISKKIIINHSYNLWEYTVFVYK